MNFLHTVNQLPAMCRFWAAAPLLAGVLLAPPLAARAAPMAISPQVAGIEQARETRLNAGWRFLRLDGNAVPPHDPSRPATSDAGWQAVTLPHTPRIEPLDANAMWQGLCWYRRHLSLSPAWRGRRVSLDFQGAMSVADVWVNGRHTITHYGGYLPFSVNLTRDLHPGDNVVAVRLDNRDNPEVPPGKPYKQLDFDWYGGLYRDVSLRVTGPLHITDPVQAGRPAGGGVFVTYPEVTTQRATVAVRLDVRNDGTSATHARTQFVLADAEGRLVAVGVSAPDLIPAGTDHEFDEQIRVTHPHLWDPEHPYLYRLHSIVLDGVGPVDALSTPVGIRRISFSASGGFQINGHRMYLRGVNRDQEYPYIGDALSDDAQYRDALKIKQGGFDFVRLSHYPQSPAFLDACDALGLVVMEPVPGWQFQGDALFQQRCFQNVRDMIRRDRDHPCVVLWETSLNETGMAKPFMDEMGRIAHEEYPGDQCYTAGWEDDYDVFLQSRQAGGCHGYHNGNKACEISEYGDWEYYARNMGLDQTAGRNKIQPQLTSRQTRADGEAGLLQQLFNFRQAADDNRTTPAVGDGLWVMYDYSRGYAPDLETSGAMDSLRIPKFSYDFFRSQRDADVPAIGGVRAGPMVALATWWNAASSPTVTVSSNCDEVALSLNGRRIARQKPDTEPGEGHLPHPTFTFALGRFTPGTLTAVGYIHGVARATATVRTPGTPAALRLHVDLSGRPLRADGADVVFVYADVVDAHGTIVPGAHPPVTFTVRGGATLVGADPAPASAGIAGILLRAGARSGTAEVSAVAGHLHAAPLRVVLVPAGR